MKHILNDVDDCVSYCPACGPPCKHGDNSYECVICKAENECGQMHSVYGPTCSLQSGHDEPCDA